MPDWYRTWFDTPYYDLLYQERDHEEARAFVEHLVSFCRLPPHAPVLDLACGAGRHSFQLARMGYRVTGVDLSLQRIRSAVDTRALLPAEIANRTRFLEGDMRSLAFDHEFAAAFNLFTSLGYFQDMEENNLVIANVARALLPGALLVIDFLNTRYVQQNLVEQEQLELAGVRFEIRRRIERGRVIKAIRVTEGDRIFHFTESVQLLGMRDFERMLKRAHLELAHLWGDYTGAPFSEDHSPRLILFARSPR